MNRTVEGDVTRGSGFTLTHKNSVDRLNIVEKSTGFSS